jgi:hypothetical protein
MKLVSCIRRILHQNSLMLCSIYGAWRIFLKSSDFRKGMWHVGFWWCTRGKKRGMKRGGGGQAITVQLIWWCKGALIKCCRGPQNLADDPGNTNMMIAKTPCISWALVLCICTAHSVTMFNLFVFLSSKREHCAFGWKDWIKTRKNVFMVADLPYTEQNC